MRRRLATLLSATLVTGIAAVLVPASPASAGAHVCAGVGKAILTTGLTFPVTVATALPGHPVHVRVQQPRTTGFTFNLNIAGGCVNTNAPTVKSTLTGTPITAVGTVSGWCGLSSGTGTVTLGASSGLFAGIGIGGILVITGNVNGVVQATDALAGHNCNTNPGAAGFVVAGAVAAFDHCVASNTGLAPVPIPATLVTTLISGPLGTPVAAVSVHTGPWHIWTKVCVISPVL